MLSHTSDSSFFVDYEEETLDPGWSLIIGSLIACILLNVTLPCTVSLGSRYERRKLLETKGNCEGSTDQENDTTSQENNNDGDDEVSKSRRNKKPVTVIDLGCGPTTSATSNDTQKYEKDNTKQDTKKINKDGADSTLRSALREQMRNTTKMTAIDEDRSIDGSKALSQQDDEKIGSNMQIVTNENNNKLVTSPACFGDIFVEWFCGFADTLDNAHLSFPRKWSQASRGGGASVASASSKTRKLKMKRSDSSIQSSDVSRASSVARSVMSKLHHDDVSFTEAIDKYNGPENSHIPKQEYEGEIDILYGKHAWWRAKVLKRGFDKIVEISEVDNEMVALLKTALPLSVQSVATAGIFNLLDVALIGHLVGTQDACVFVVVSLLTWLPTTFTYGFFEALAKMIPPAVEKDEYVLAGAFLNASISLFTLAMIPIGILWSYLTSQTFLWIGFDSETAELAQKYAYIQVILEWITGVGYCIHLFLDLSGHERYSSFANLAFGVGQTLGVIIQSLAGQNGLVNVGLCRATFAAVHVLGSVLLVTCFGWLDQYSNGIADFPFRNPSAVKAIFTTGCPMGVAYFLSYGEWELLALFAKALGPAEVVAWAMLGYLWSIFKYFSDGFADAAESRCALHLVSNQPELARMCAYKSQFLGLFSSLFVTSLLFLVGMELAQGITTDLTLQQLMIETFPLIGMGNVVQSAGFISASLLGGQGRPGMATLVQFVGNWCVTIFLASIFTYGLHIDLQGVTSALVLGLALSGAGNTYLLLRSEWEGLASILSEGFEDITLTEERQDGG